MAKKAKVIKKTKAVKKIVKSAPAKPLKVKKLTEKEKRKIEKAKMDDAMTKKPKDWITAFLGLGSNVGDREEYIEQAAFLMAKMPNLKVVKKASNYETDPEINSKQPPYINTVFQIKTKLSPYELLNTVNDMENTLGRERGVEWGPRTIDIDILLYGDQVLSDDKLTIPHPLLHDRKFVLEPLAEIAPNTEHPIMDKKIIDMFREKQTEAGEKYDDGLPGFKNIKSGVYDDFERW